MHTTSLKPGDFFWHPQPRWSGHGRMSAIWLALVEGQAISVKSGSIVNIGAGEASVFGQVMFLDMDKILHLDQMKGGSIFMAGNDMLIKSNCGRYFSLGGGQLYSEGNTYAGWDWNALYPVFELCLAEHGKTPRPVADYVLTR